MLNMNEWMKLWGLDPKTGLPTLWKMWWPWLDAEQPLFRMQVRMGSFHIQQPVAVKSTVLKQAEVIEQPAVQKAAVEASQPLKLRQPLKLPQKRQWLKKPQ